MASIQTGIQLRDSFSGVMMGIINSVNLAVSSVYDMQQAMNSDIDTSSLEGAREEINRAAAAAQEFIQTMADANGRIAPAAGMLPPATQPMEWQTDAAFDTSAAGGYIWEIETVNKMLGNMNDWQWKIENSAAEMDILPPAAVQDISRLGARIDTIKERVQKMGSVPVNLRTDAANNELQRLRSQLDQAIQEQGNLDRAMQDMDVSTANQSYLKLSQTIRAAEEQIRSSVVKQEQFNQRIQQGAGNINTFKGAVQTLHAPIAKAETGFRGWQKAIIVANQSLSLVRNTLGRLGVTDMSGAFDRMDTMNRFQKTITTMTGDAGLANAALNTLKDTTLGTAYGLDVAAGATQGFMTRGMSLGTATDQVRIWADAVSFYGKGTNEQLESVVDAIGKMYSKGTVEADQLDRLFDAGIGAAEIYANAVGQNVSRVKDDLSDGKISAAQFISTISQAMDNGISNGAAKQAGDTWATTFSNMRASFARGWVSMIEKTDAALAKHNLPSIMEMFTMVGQKVETTLNSIGDSMDTVIGYGVKAYDILSTAFEFIGDNWSVIAPVILTAAVAMGAYTAAATAFNIVQGISNTLEMVSAAHTAIKTGATIAGATATTTATGAQISFNAALLACPITWIVGGIILAVGAFYAVIAVINKVENKSMSATGKICGAINVANKAIENTLHLCWNVSLGIWNAFDACISNIDAAFHNAGLNILIFFDDVAIGSIDAITAIGEALNKLPFIDFDLDGLKSSAASWAAKKIELQDQKWDYKNIADAFNDGFNTFETFKEGWVDEAYNEGHNLGTSIENFFKDFLDNSQNGEEEEGYQQLHDKLANTSNDLRNIGDDTNKISKQLEITSEDLKYIRDLAEQDYINRFTTASITVNQTNHNTVNKDMDLDGITEHLRTTVEEQMDAAAEGAH